MGLIKFYRNSKAAIMKEVSFPASLKLFFKLNIFFYCLFLS